VQAAEAQDYELLAAELKKYKELIQKIKCEHLHRPASLPDDQILAELAKRAQNEERLQMQNEDYIV